MATLGFGALNERKGLVVRDSLVLPLVACATLLSSCAGIQPALLLSGYESAVDNPTDFWCGNQPRGASTAPCYGLSTTATGRIPSRMVEVRGWLVRDPYYYPEDNEFIFHLLLDHGWTPASAAAEHAEPLNTIEQINAAITPHNVVGFGRGPNSEATAWLGNGAWGGPNGLVLHIEINGWGSNPQTEPERIRQLPPPRDWVFNSNTPGVAWAFNPYAPPTVQGREPGLVTGDYVRMVGLLWEDVPHDGSPEGRLGIDGDRTVDGKQCWRTGRHAEGYNYGGEIGRGFTELHPVDFLAEIDPPRRSDTLFVVALCGESFIDLNIVPPGPRPAGARAAFEEYIDAEFTSLGAVTRKRVTAMDDRVHLDIIVRDRGRSEPKFKAIYRVYWQE